jgi:N-acetylmuramoyl-L-alanine amidase
VDLTKIKFDFSPNFGVRGDHKIDHIILHAALGTFTGALTTLKNPKNPLGPVSAHYLIDRDGTIIQLVKLEYAAWHAMHYPNLISIGIEHVDRYNLGGTITLGCMHDKQWMALPQFKASAALVAQLMKNFNVKLENVIGHNDSWLRQFGNNHSCPGPYFPWLTYKAEVQTQLALLNQPATPRLRPGRRLTNLNS